MKTGSYIGWIDMTAGDLSRARDYLRQLEEGTLDELGFGIIRDFFSEKFFPATSTVMTIARQYVLVPFCCLHLESRILKEGWDLRRTRKELYDMENHLRECVSDIRNKDVLRLPSSIFWPALSKLGIFTGECSLYTYLRREVEASSRHYRDDDKTDHVSSEEASPWDKELLGLFEKEKENLFENNRFCFDDPADKSANSRMKQAEAKYLQRVYSRHAENKPSIMSHILQKELEPINYYPWEMECPHGLQDYVKDAQCFSLLVRGASLIYYQLLVEERKKRGLPELENVPDFDEYFSAWWSISHKRLQDWEFNKFLVRVQEALRSRRKDREFLTEFLGNVREFSHANEFFRSTSVRKMVRDREKRVRPIKSRLNNPKYLDQWRPGEYDITAPNTVYGFDFRGKVAVRLCGEIISGLKGRKHNG